MCERLEACVLVPRNYVNLRWMWQPACNFNTRKVTGYYWRNWLGSSIISNSSGVNEKTASSHRVEKDWGKSDTSFIILQVEAYVGKHQHTQVYPHKCECTCICECAQHNTLRKKERKEKLGFLVFVITIKSKDLLATSLSSLAHKLFIQMHIDNIIILVLSH